jgi:hypothetical protein
VSLSYFLFLVFSMDLLTPFSPHIPSAVFFIVFIVIIVHLFAVLTAVAGGLAVPDGTAAGGWTTVLYVLVSF